MPTVPKLSNDQWLEIRGKFESDPCLTFGTLAAAYGVSRQAIFKRSKDEVWEKPANMGEIVHAAQRRADGLQIDNAVDTPLDPKGVACREVGTQEAIDIRANILAEQRQEIKTVPKLQKDSITLFNVAMKASAAAKNSDDTNIKAREKAAWLIAKLSADTVKIHAAIIQMKNDIEAKAWGLDIFQLEQNIIPNLNLLTEDELNLIADKGEFPAYMLKNLRL